MKIIFLGAPGAGKGTQAEMIRGKLGIPIISTGDIFRQNIKNRTPLGEKVKAIIDSGELVPDSLVTELVSDRISREDCAGGYILDGFPRTIPQAEEFDRILAEKGDAIDLVIDVEVPDEAIVSRMGGRRTCPVCGESFHVVYKAPRKENICDRCGGPLTIRDDDKEEVVKNRLVVYHKNTQPLISYYEEKGKLRRVDGTRDIGEVHEEIVGLL